MPGMRLASSEASRSSHGVQRCPQRTRLAMRPPRLDVRNRHTRVVKTQIYALRRRRNVISSPLYVSLNREIQQGAFLCPNMIDPVNLCSMLHVLQLNLDYCLIKI